MTTIYYTRCPVPTASGVAFQADLFAQTFADTGYQIRNITELGPEAQNVHYTHAIDEFFREGGAAPPIWSKANGVDSVVLAMTFVEEMLGIYVRVDDPARSVSDLAGRNLAAPVWPRLVFNFWRCIGLLGYRSALSTVGLDLDDVNLVDVVEGWDPSERRNVSADGISKPARCEYRNQLGALLDGTVDALFAKGLEAALLEREAEGRIRLLVDQREFQDPDWKARASIPRVLTTSRRFLEEHPQAAVNYMRALIRASRWADAEPIQVAPLIARECGVEHGGIGAFVGPDMHNNLLPRVTPGMTESLQRTIDQTHELGFSEQRFSVHEWIDQSALHAAYDLEGVSE